jgi:hypothetical protein
MILISAFAPGAKAQAQPPSSPNTPPFAASLPDKPQSGQVASGTISGQVADNSGAAIVGAHVKLTLDGTSASQEVLAGDNGQFSFVNVAPGLFHLTVSSASFATLTTSGELHPGEVDVMPLIQLQLATAVTEVHVAATQEEIAEIQIKEEEKQRVLGFMPNFYVSYDPNAVPLNPKQKFELAWKTSLDPVTFMFVGISAGIQQAQNSPKDFGQGAAGYGSRFGASFADQVTNNFIGGAILPSLFKQDPRYFYKGTGSKRSRALYAIANAVICKGDNGKWQPGYSGVLGSLMAGGISTAYYPANDRSAGLVFQNTAIGLGANAVGNLFQEFVVKKFTPNLPKHDPANAPASTP